MKAAMALARKVATVLPRIWADGTEFVWGKDPARTTGHVALQHALS